MYEDCNKMHDQHNIKVRIEVLNKRMARIGVAQNMVQKMKFGFP